MVSEHNETRKGFWAGLSVLYVLIAGLLALTWRRLPDAVVDFGRELYVPWRMVQGDTLYTDITYFNGPLSPYFNAVVFDWFGISVTTLMITNTVLLVGLTTIIYRLVVNMVSIRTAVISTAMFLVVFGFSHALRIGNYNYICPYSHEMTHGVTLIFAMLMLITSRFGSTIIGQWCVGFLLGLVFLGKAELFVAASGMLAARLFLDNFKSQQPLRDGYFQCARYFSGAIIPVLFFSWLLAYKMPWPQAINGVMGTWHWIVNSNVADGEFYRRMSGLDQPWNNLIVIGKAAVSVALAIALGKSFESYRVGQSRMRRRWLALAAASLAGIAWLNQGVFPVILQSAALPLIALVIFVVAMTVWIKNGESGKQNELVIGWVVMAGLLMAKFPLRASIVHYGFVLAMPIVVLAVALSLERLPRMICSRTGGATCYSVLCFMLLADVLGFGAMTASNIAAKQQRLSNGHDLLWVDEERGGKHIADAVELIKSTTAPSDTVLVLPEGVMINYQTRRASSTPFVNLCPPELTMYGEDTILASFAQTPADYVVLVNKDVSEYGKSFFGGDDYGRLLMDWVYANYEIQRVFGSSFHDSKKHGVTVMRRKLAVISRQAFVE